MDILNNINLNGNTITSATLNNSVIGSNTTTTPGAIKYGSGLLSYYDGGTWVTLGSGSGETIEVSGYFNITDGENTYSVQSTPGSASHTISFTSTNDGWMHISELSNNITPSMISIPTTYMKTTGSIFIGTEYSDGTTITITHNLDTYNVMVQIWYREAEKDYWELVSADVKAPTSNTVTVLVGGESKNYYGYYKVLIFRGYEQIIGLGDITTQGHGQIL